MSLECLVWKTNPLYWQMVAGIKVGKGALGINGQTSCKAKGRQIAENFGISNFVSNSMIKCACEHVFSGDPPHIPVWHNWESLGAPTNTIVSGDIGAVGVPNTDITDLYVRGSDAKLWQKYWTNGQWSNWIPLDPNPNFKLASSPVVVSRHAAHRAIYALGQDGNVYHKYYDGQWHTWENLGGSGKVKGDIGAVLVPNTNITDLYMRGVDGTLYQQYWDNKWSGWVKIDPSLKLVSSPVAVSRHPAHRAVYAQGSNGNVYHKYYDGQWHGWENLGGVIKGDVGAVLVPSTNITDLYVRGVDGTLYQQYWDNKWSGWFQVDPSFVMTNSPAAVSIHAAHRAIYATGQDGNVYHKYWL